MEGEVVMKFFEGMHNVATRDKTRVWADSRVETPHFSAAAQPVPSYQNPWELAQLLDIYHTNAPKSYLELGPYHGGTLYWFIKNAVCGCKLGGVDLFDELLGQRWTTPADWDKWVEDANTEKGIKANALFDIQFKLFEGDTHDPAIIAAVTEYYEGSLDWLFIDANHEYVHCRQELADYGALLHEGSVLCLHDVRPRNMGSNRLWEELRHAGYKTQLIVADPTSETVDAGIGVVYL